MTIIKIVAFAIIFILAVVFYTLQKNDAYLFQAPGFYKRLTTYLTTNTVTTSDNQLFEELRSPVFSIGADKLYQRVLNKAAVLGWEVLAKDDENQNVNFVVRTALFSFEDDVYVQVKFLNLEQSTLYIQSSSRKGKADFGANVGHIQTLLHALKK